MQFRGEPGAVRRSQDSGGVAAHGEEGHVPEVQQAGQADHDVQAEGQQQEEPHIGQQLVHDLAEEHRQDDAQHCDHHEQHNRCLLALDTLQVPVTLGGCLHPTVSHQRQDTDYRPDHDDRGEGQAALLGIHELVQPFEPETLRQVVDDGLQDRQGNQPEQHEGGEPPDGPRHDTERGPGQAESGPGDDPRHSTETHAVLVGQEAKQLRAPVDQWVPQVP